MANSEPIKTRRKFFGMDANVFFLGLVSLLTDVSSELIFTLIPLFLENVLGVKTAVVGFIGGLSDSTDAIFRIISGWFSDKIGKRKVLAGAGYTLSNLVKPLMYFAGSWGAVAGIRFGDRIGKGVRTASRDALIADSVSKEQRGRGFGLHRAMDTTGAFLGLLIATLIIYLVQGTGANLLAKESYRWMVVAGTVPGILAVLVLVTLVRERKKSDGVPAESQTTGITPRVKTNFDKRFIIFLAVMAVFTLGNSSDFFLILRAQNVQTPLIQVVLMLVLFNLTYSLISLPMGILSDKLGRRRVIIAGWLVYALVYFGFALAGAIWQIWVLFAVYGLYYGMVEGAAKAFVADMVPAEKRGTAYGLFNGVVGLMALPASVIAGWMWDAISPAATFYFGAGLAFLAMVGILFLVKERTR
ncbi:MAG: MFS transporter [Dehalococcoidales bacterium]|nr:MFS transporter [Dehalococcoidales bacterium]